MNARVRKKEQKESERGRNLGRIFFFQNDPADGQYGRRTRFVNRVRDEILPQLRVILVFGKLDGFVHIPQLLHDHLQSSTAVPHPAWEKHGGLGFLLKLKTHLEQENRH